MKQFSFGKGSLTARVLRVFVLGVSSVPSWKGGEKSVQADSATGYVDWRAAEAASLKAESGIAGAYMLVDRQRLAR